MTGSLPVFEIERSLLAEAGDVLAAREKSHVIHRTRDVGTAGDEVEIAARSVIAGKMPGRCVVTHGHILDSKLRTSGQLDVIVADKGTMTTLFKAQNGAEYVPYESVFAVGEVKSSYYKSKDYIRAFCEKVRKTKQELSRAPSPPHPLVVPVQPSGNALFSFMLFADSGDFDMSQVASLYRELPQDQLPNIVCFLDLGVIINTKTSFHPDGKVKMGSINISPGVPPTAYGPENLWSLVNFGNNEVRPASSLGMLLVMLTEHVNRSVLHTPPMLEYFRSMFSVNGGTTVFATE